MTASLFLASTSVPTAVMILPCLSDDISAAIASRTCNFGLTPFWLRISLGFVRRHKGERAPCGCRLDALTPI